jgi:hypothetical protein
MKIFRIGIIFISLCILVSCSGDHPKVPGSVVNIPNTASGSEIEGKLPIIEFDKTEHDFGKVIRGEIVSYRFKFKNTGSSDLIIANISAACGCTASEYPKEPIAPGEENYIEVVFKSAGKKGFQNKTLEIAANTQPTNTVIAIKAMVIIPEKD